MSRFIGHVGGFKGCRMMELGNQQMMAHQAIAEGSAAKLWFESQGVIHTSVDLNGQLGAIAVNLAEPVDRPEWVGAFDVVTDFGTSEHVGNTVEALYNARKNCHTWCRVGGLMLFSNPMTGHWPGHGHHYFTRKHYLDLAMAFDYQVLDTWEHPTCGNYETGMQISAALVKLRESAFSFDLFVRACIRTVYRQ